jgi:hypothetical protein
VLRRESQSVCAASTVLWRSLFSHQPQQHDRRKWDATPCLMWCHILTPSLPLVIVNCCQIAIQTAAEISFLLQCLLSYWQYVNSSMTNWQNWFPHLCRSHAMAISNCLKLGRIHNHSPHPWLFQRWSKKLDEGWQVRYNRSTIPLK